MSSLPAKKKPISRSRQSKTSGKKQSKVSEKENLHVSFSENEDVSAPIDIQNFLESDKEDEIMVDILTG